MHPRKLFLGIALPAFLFLLAWSVAVSPLFAQNTVSATWNGGAGTWSSPGNWTNSNGAIAYPNNAPPTFYNVTIDSGTQNDMVTLDTSPNVDGLTLGDSKNTTFTDALTIPSNESLTVGRSNTNGALTLGANAMLNVNGGSLQLNANRGFELYNTGGVVNVRGGTIVMNGEGAGFDLIDLSFSGKGVLTLSNGGSIVGASGTEGFYSGERIQGSGTISNLTFANGGTLVANGSAPMVIIPNSGGFSNGNILQVAAGSTLRVSTANGGAFNSLQDGDLTEGIYNVAGTFQYGGGNTITTLGTSGGTSGPQVTLSGSGFITPDGTTNALKTLTADNGVLRLTGGATLSLSSPSLSVQRFYSGLEVDANSFLSTPNLTNVSNGTLSGGVYTVGGTLQYGGGSGNTLTALNDAIVTLSGAGLITPDGKTNGLASLQFISTNSQLILENGADLNLTSLTILPYSTSTGFGYVEVGAGSALTTVALTDLSSGMLSQGAYAVGGLFQYGGGSGNTVRIIGGDASVGLTGNGLMTPDGTTNGLATLAINDGSLSLDEGASLKLTSPSFTNNFSIVAFRGGELSTPHFTNVNNGVLSGGDYDLYGGTFQYGGGSGNVINVNNAYVLLGNAGLMTPDGKTNGLASLAVNNGTFALDSDEVMSLSSPSFTNNNLLGVGPTTSLTVSQLNDPRL